ncbi:MAG: antitoxin [Solirubrobacterales bacterium]|nr:antitoxin [Solirubrobacterales bacterium]
MARTTLDLDAAVRDELRRRSEAQRKSMGTVASELLAVALASTKGAEPPLPFAWRSAELGIPRVDLEDEEAVRQAMGT